MTEEVIVLVNEQIRFDLSPEQVSGWLKEQHGILLSHERIYQPIRADRRNGGDLYTHLRQAHKKRRKTYGSKDKRGQICNRVSIDQRPDIVDEKSRIGDWEIDTVIGQNHKGAVRGVTTDLGYVQHIVKVMHQIHLEVVVAPMVSVFLVINFSFPSSNCQVR
jgi:IS30 family transposase